MADVHLLKLPAAVREALVAHAQREAPIECCGLLIGKGNAVSDAHPARNKEGSHTRFQINPADHFAAIRKARAAGLDVIGAYHSHPETPALPSARDIAEASEGAPVMVIVSLMPPEPAVRAFLLEPSGSKEIRIVS
ncbi:MAG: M67 family metallopeptidase [Acidobacteriota bacterium]|nr:M67 family metallopeptidase [Acidobacteriota bacterium]